MPFCGKKGGVWGDAERGWSKGSLGAIGCIVKILAAVDVAKGVVVRGIAGHRETYAPLVSQLVAGSGPNDIAQALAEQLDIRDLYLADLDAIAGDEPDWSLYERLLAGGARLSIDAGIGDAVRAQELRDFAARFDGVDAVIVGLESIANPEQLRQVAAIVPPQQLVFSLDLKDGRPFGATEAWHDADPVTIASEVVELGIRRLIVLDLAAVGVDGGCPTLPLCRDLRSRFPEIEITTGGGLRDKADLRGLADAGCNAALIASSLHDGRLSREELASFAS